MAFGQTRQINAPTATTCKGASASVSTYTYATTNNQLLDISPTGNMCAGTWNRNSGGGIPDYTICNPPNPLPKTGGLPYGTRLHFRVCQLSNLESRAGVCACTGEFGHIGDSRDERGLPAMLFPGRERQPDSEACFASNGTQYEFCAPSTVTQLFLPGRIASGRHFGSSCSNCDRNSDLRGLDLFGCFA